MPCQILVPLKVIEMSARLASLPDAMTGSRPPAAKVTSLALAKVKVAMLAGRAPHKVYAMRR
jgi:hypothetical protein